MGLFTLEHGKTAYRIDFAVYGGAVVALAVVLALFPPAGRHAVDAAWVVVGMAAWTLLEYGLHRFVLHGVDPFMRWHEEHHRRPSALICSPTIFSASLVFLLVFVPAWWIADVWVACALTFGVLSGYLVYAVTHHATHHWRGQGAWLKSRKRWHALHHHDILRPRRFGVTSGFWDHVFRSGESTRLE